MMVDIQTKQQAEKQAMADLVSGLSTEWGAAFEQNKHLGNIAVEEGTMGNPELKERLLAKSWWNDPDVVRFNSNLGKKFAEGKPPNFANIPTPGDLQTQINELMASPILTDPKSTIAQRKLIMDKVMALRTKMPVKTT